MESLPQPMEQQQIQSFQPPFHRLCHCQVSHQAMGLQLADLSRLAVQVPTFDLNFKWPKVEENGKIYENISSVFGICFFLIWFIYVHVQIAWFLENRLGRLWTQNQVRSPRTRTNCSSKDVFERDPTAPWYIYPGLLNQKRDVKRCIWLSHDWCYGYKNLTNDICFVYKKGNGQVNGVILVDDFNTSSCAAKGAIAWPAANCQAPSGQSKSSAAVSVPRKGTNIGTTWMV